MRTLVTGGAGFIGSHLVNRLVDDGRDVVVLDVLESQVHGSGSTALPPDVTFVEGDVGDPAALDAVLDGVSGFADVERAKRLLSFEASTDSRAGIGELAAWIADQEAVDRVDEAKAELVSRGLAF